MVTHLESKNNTNGISIIPVEEVYRRITSDNELKESIQEIRTLNRQYQESEDRALFLQKEALKTQLPAFIIAGEFTDRQNDSMTDYWGRVIISLDNLTDPDKLKAEILQAADPSLLLLFVSPSGNGLKAVHKIRQNDFSTADIREEYHRQAHGSLVNYYEQKHDIAILSNSGAELSQLCYYSFDETAFYNPEPSERLFEIEGEGSFNEPIYSSEIDGYYTRFRREINSLNLDFVQNVQQWCISKKLSIVNNIDDWSRVTYAFRNSFEETQMGFELFQRISTVNSSITRDQCKFMWDRDDLDEKFKSADLGTVLYMIRRLGWTQQKRLRLGMMIKLNSFVTSLEESDIRFRYNELTKQLYYSEVPGSEVWHLADDYIMGKLKLEVFETQMKREEFDHFINFIPPRFNPVTDFLSSLPKWDEKDHIKELFGTVRLADTGKDMMAEKLLRKWLIGVINGLHNNPENAKDQTKSPNENLLILSGPQGIGKTRWTRKLFPERWHTLFAEKPNMNFDDKDDRLLSCEKAIISMDEMSPWLNNKASNEQLKSFLSQRTFSIRVAYGKFNSGFYKIASFIGTSNHIEMITDPTGARRIWPIEIETADYRHQIDMEQLWSQVYVHWKDGEVHWLNSQEQIELAQYNEPFRKPHAYEEYINRFVQKGDGRYTATQIAEHICDMVGNKNAVNPNILGTYMKRAGYQNRPIHHEGKTHRIYNVLLLNNNEPDITGHLLGPQ